MELRLLGKTGIRVSPIGLGTVKFGRNTGVKYPGGAGFALPTDEEVTALLGRAAELGINLIDTAPAYGTSEERIGAIMRRNGWFGGRERWVVSTKAGEEFDGATGHSRFDFSADAIRRSVERSLDRLKVEVLDIVLLHSDGRDEWVLRESGGMDVLAELKHEGRVRAIGASTKLISGGLAAMTGCDVIMVSYSEAEPESREVVDAAVCAGVGVLVKKGLASGHATNAESAVRFALAPKGVGSVVVGTTSLVHLEANCAAAGKAG